MPSWALGILQVSCQHALSCLTSSWRWEWFSFKVSDHHTFPCLISPRKREWFFCNFLFIVPFFSLPYPESESDFSKLFFATLPFLAYLIQKEALSIKSSCHFYQLHVFCHRPRNHPHNQGSGVELELGDSTSLEWEEEFVLAAQRYFRCLQKWAYNWTTRICSRCSKVFSMSAKNVLTFEQPGYRMKM